MVRHWPQDWNVQLGRRGRDLQLRNRALLVRGQHKQTFSLDSDGEMGLRLGARFPVGSGAVAVQLRGEPATPTGQETRNRPR